MFFNLSLLETSLENSDLKDQVDLETEVDQPTVERVSDSTVVFVENELAEEDIDTIMEAVEYCVQNLADCKSRVLANERRLYICNILSHWRKY